MTNELPNHLLQQARSLALEHRYDEALRILEGFVVAYPGAVDGLILMGGVNGMRASGDGNLSPEDRDAANQRARQCFEEALEREPTCVWALTDLGDWHSFQGHYEDALRFYDRAIALLEKGTSWRSLKDEAEEAYWARAAALDHLGRCGEAEECRKRGRTLNPDSVLLGEPRLRLHR